MQPRSLLWIVALGGCGGDPARPDAEPMPDATPPDLGCEGAAVPTTAPDPIVINGQAYASSPLGQADLEGALIEAFQASGGGALFLDSSDADGLYTLTVTNAAMVPLDGYLRGRAAGFVDTYLYPPFPLAQDTDDAPLMFATEDTLGQLAFTSGVNQSPSLGLFGVLVQDCVSNPVTGATVTVSPVSTDPSFETTVVYVAEGNFPDIAATATRDIGVAFVFNVPLGATVVDAELNGTSFLEHAVTSRADVVTTTAVAPGPGIP